MWISKALDSRFRGNDGFGANDGVVRDLWSSARRRLFIWIAASLPDGPKGAGRRPSGLPLDPWPFADASRRFPAVLASQRRPDTRCGFASAQISGLLPLSGSAPRRTLRGLSFGAGALIFTVVKAGLLIASLRLLVNLSSLCLWGERRLRGWYAKTRA